jgi:23S rRNA (uracil1939-C5)-methyltransferase
VSTDDREPTQEAGTVVLRIASLAHGPDAVARHEGRVVFVPGAAPGDTVRVRLIEERGSYARAEVLERRAAGPAYREPPCPWVAACGGCPWQQIAYPVQLESKARNVHEALARIAGVTTARELPILHAPSEWEYRHRIRLHVDEAGRLGYVRPRSREIVEIGACVVADPALSSIVPALRRALPSLGIRIEAIELVTNGRGGVVLLANAGGAAREDDEAAMARLMREIPSVAGMRLSGRGWQRMAGDLRITVSGPDDEVALTQRAGSFTQVNPAANRLLVRTVVAMAAPATRVLDLFCGAGNLSLPLARAGAQVHGIDRDAAAVADAAASATAAGLRRTRFEATPAERFLRQQGTGGADLVILDPPRTGARAVATQLGRLRARRILYVSCDPATLARDARILVGGGYRVARVQPIDLFPQTEHVETVLEAVLTGT